MPKRKIATPRDTFDEPWKQIVQTLFEPFLRFFAPELAEKVDWAHEPDFRDKELLRIAKGFGGRRRMTADFLIRLWLRSGDEQWLIIHIELQAQKDADFPLRMFLYNVRAFDLHDLPVASLAILADTDPNWRPNAYGYSTPLSETQFQFSTVKLLDYRDRQVELEASDNPFGLAVLAHLKTMETRGDADARLQTKIRLTRMLFQRRWKRQPVAELLQFLDWIMSLPDPEEDRFEETYRQIVEENSMAETMAPLLRRERARGELSATRALLFRLGRKRLGEPSESVERRITEIADRERLELLCEQIYERESWDELLSIG